MTNDDADASQPDDLDRMLARYFAARSARESLPSRAKEAADELDAGPLADCLGPMPFEQRYTDFHEIGRGGMGQVLRAWDRQLDREVALKILPGPLAATPGRLRQFLDEARTCARLQHPGILPIHDVGVARDGRPYLAMKLVHGTELGTVIKEARWNADARHRSLTSFAAIAHALAYAHARGVAHCDLKPSNVMVGRFGEVLVMDWGLARTFPAGMDRQGTPPGGLRASSAVGTIPYCSPEQARGEVERFDARTDVFALGAILCEILTGLPPYPPGEGDALAKARSGDLRRTSERLRACDAEVEWKDLITRCLDPHPQHRPQSAAEVADTVERHLEALAERTHRAEVRAAASQVRARWTLALAGIVLVAVTTGLLGWHWYRSDRDARRQRAETAVRTALQEARVLRDQAEANAGFDLLPWRRAVAMATNAAIVAQTPETPSELIAEAQSLRTAVQARAERQERDAALRQGLLEIRLARAERRSHDHGGSRTATGAVERELLAREHCAREHAAAFRAYGVDVLDLDAAVAAESLRGPLLPDLVAALDYWCLMTVGDARFAAENKRLIPLLAQLDVDPWRHALREQYVRDPDVDVARLQSLAADAAAFGQPPVHTLILCTLLAAEGHLPAALQACRQARAVHPADFELAMWLGQACGRPPRPDHVEAVAAFRVATVLCPERTDALHGLGIALVEAGDLEAARATFERLVALEPGRGHWLGHLAEVLGRLGRQRNEPALLEQALTTAQRARELEPTGPQRLYLGTILGERGEFATAVAELQGAAKERSLGVRPWLQLAEVHHKRNDPVARIAAMREALALAPDDPHLHCNLARLLSGSKGDEEAVRLYRRAIELAPEEPQFHHNLATVLFDLGRTDEAMDAIRTAVLRNPGDRMLQRMLAELHSLAGDFQGTVDVLERVVRQSVGDFIVFSNLANAYLTVGQPREAMQAADQAIRLAPNRPEPHRTRADAQRELGDFAGALATLQQAAERSPADPFVQVDLVCSLLENGRLEQCRAARDAAAERFPDTSHPEFRGKLAQVDWILSGLGRSEAIAAGSVADPTLDELVLAANTAHLFQRFRQASKLWSEVFELAPEMMSSEHGASAQNAAGCALAALRDPTLTEAERSRMRMQARQWLQAFADACCVAAPSERERLARADDLVRLLRANAFVDVRDATALANLPDEEAQDWRRFWSGVEQALRSMAPQRAAAPVGASR